MGKKSIKEDKNRYFQSRENAGLTRAEASERMDYMTESKITNIELEKPRVYPDDVVAMATAYNDALLCNYYCKHECAIGREHVPEVKEAPLANISLEILASINNLAKQQERLIEITSDGNISEDEYKDFITIKKRLEELATAVSALKLWVNKAKISETIDAAIYDSISQSEE